MTRWPEGLDRPARANRALRETAVLQQTVIQHQRARYGEIQGTRVTGFLWDRGGDRLWRQGIDLIGDDRGGQVGKGIEDGAMLGQSEGGEFLDMPDDGFDDVAPVEQCLVEERHR